MLRIEKKLPKILLTSSALALIMFASGCSDDSQNRGALPTTHSKAKTVALKFNTAPVANAGAEQIVSVGDIITLNGTQSVDADHDLMTFNWSQQSGPAVEIVNADTLTPSFVAPSSKEPLVFALIVSDGQDESEASTVKVSISNRSPMANAGRTIIAKRGATVTLDGVSSIDPDNDKISYKWNQVYGEKVAMNNPASASPSFTMPKSSGYLIFALSVSDGIDSSIADTVAVKVTNTAPIAKIASVTSNVIAGKSVVLDGSASSDADGDTLAYSWNQVLGTPVMLNNSGSSKPSFVAPERPDHLVFELTTNDGELTSHTDSVIVSVKNEIKPLETQRNLNSIARTSKKVETLKPVNRDRAVLDVASAREAVSNFLPEIAKTFVSPVHAAPHKTGGHHAAKSSHAKKHWSYAGDTGPSHWASLEDKFSVCGSGQTQSPIDIHTKGLTQSAKPIEFHYTTSVINIVNNGHTIQANYDGGSYAVIDGKKFNLLQFHFHSPSENTIDGKPADMVAHMVHKAEDGTLGVVGVLFKEGKENEFLKPIWSNLPLESGTKTSSKDTIFASNMLPEDKAYYHFTGSLTTPPCSEGVNWNVMAATVTVSRTQIDTFTSIFDKSVRPVQALNGRKIALR